MPWSNWVRRRGKLGVIFISCRSARILVPPEFRTSAGLFILDLDHENGRAATRLGLSRLGCCRLSYRTPSTMAPGRAATPSGSGGPPRAPTQDVAARLRQRTRTAGTRDRTEEEGLAVWEVAAGKHVTLSRGRAGKCGVPGAPAA